MKRFRFLPLTLLAVTLSYATGPKQEKVLLSPVYTIDKKFKSMEGPQSVQTVNVLETSKPELLWITGFKTEMVGEDGKTPSLPEFMCHVNIDFDPARHKQIFSRSPASNARILTLSQGQTETFFPDGFGLPVMSNESIFMNTQVLNFNVEEATFKVRHRVTFQYIRDAETKKPMKALFAANGFGMQLLEGDSGHYGISNADTETFGPSCLPGESAPNAKGGSVYADQFAKKFTGHWVVKPGREVNHTNITKYLGLPFDTTLHYAAVHLHPYSESLELRDITAKKTLFKSVTKNFKNKIGLVDVSSYSDKKGIPLYKDHEYELISTYNNTTSINQDSMAVMMLFLYDKNFTKPVATNPALQAGLSRFNIPPAIVAGPRPRLVLTTTAGKITAELWSDITPQTVAQIVRLVKAGLYDTTPFYRLESGFVLQTANVQGRRLPLTPEQTAMLTKIPAEFSGSKHKRGTLSMARYDEDENSAESSFSILLANAPHLDGKYASFGKIISGWDVLEKLEASPVKPGTKEPAQPIEIIKAELLEKPAKK